MPQKGATSRRVRMAMTIRVLNACLFAGMALYFWRLPSSHAQLRPSEFTRAEQAEIDARVKAQVQEKAIDTLNGNLMQVRAELALLNQEHKDMRAEMVAVKWSAIGFGAALSALHLVGLILGRRNGK